MPKSYPYTPPTRMEYMVEKYGECCRKSDAAHILGRSPATIAEMLRDGRLEAVCEGKMVSVTSLARYMDKPAQKDFEARQKRRRPNQRHFVTP